MDARARHGHEALVKPQGYANARLAGARMYRSGENIPTLPASDWSAVRISPRFQRPIGPS
eukprot:6978646-Pyramimonas_sp.AAC.1